MKRSSHKHLDDAAVFKRRNLKAIERNKKMTKLLFASMIIIAFIMLIAVIATYTIG